MERQIKSRIISDLKKKMVLLSGPRQVGKSFLAKMIMEEFKQPRYLNWDSTKDRKVILDEGWSTHTDLLVLDEIHKMASWKNFLKGVYDTKPPSLSILVTGSARLETFRRSGDSLAGRYFHHRLLPVTPSEAGHVHLEKPLHHYLNRGGFPEPFLVENDNEAGRWRRQYIDGLIREDILNFENITQLKAMNLLVEMLRERVTAPLSYQGLSEDLDISPNTVKHYLEILEALYIVFRIYPYHHSITRSLKKQPKLYFFDTGLIKGDPGVKLENCVALSLYRENCLKEDQDGKKRELGYLKTKEGREVDFLLLEDQVPKTMIEVKASKSSLSNNLKYFHERYQIPGIQLVGDLRLEYETGSLKVLKAMEWLSCPEF